MAEILGMVALPSFVLASLVVGTRLLRLAARTRELPEFAIGLNFVVGGGFGYTLLVVAESLLLLPDSLTGPGSFAGITAVCVGAAFMVVFTHRVFRPGSPISGAALALLVGWLALGIWGSWELHVARAEAGLGLWLGRWGPNLGLSAAYAWSTAEALRYAERLRRQARIGFGDPLVANRLRLWGVASGAIAVVSFLHLVAQMAGHYALPPSLVGVAASLLLVTAVAQWLAFFPPAAYLRRFARTTTED